MKGQSQGHYNINISRKGAELSQCYYQTLIAKSIRGVYLCNYSGLVTLKGPYQDHSDFEGLYPVMEHS